MHAAIDRPVQTPFGAIAPELAGYAGINDVSVLRVHDDPRDPFAVRQPHVRPVFAAVGRLVDPVADRYAVARPAFTRADPHDVGVRRIERNRADRLHGRFIEDWFERGSAVGRSPYSAGSCADEQRHLAVFFLPARDRRDAARHCGRADVAYA